MKESLVFLAVCLVGVSIPVIIPAQVPQAGIQATRLVCYTFPCTWSEGASTFMLSPDGVLNGREREGATRTGRLPVPEGFEITRVLSASVGQDLLVAYELEDGEVGVARVVRLDGRSLLRRWVLEIKAFNLSAGTFEGSYMYQAAIGVVAKIDLRRGGFVWKHEGLYDRARGAFGAFAPPVVGLLEVEFTDQPASGTGSARIRVNKRTGKLRVE